MKYSNEFLFKYYLIGLKCFPTLTVCIPTYMHEIQSFEFWKNPYLTIFLRRENEKSTSERSTRLPKAAKQQEAQTRLRFEEPFEIIFTEANR